MISSKSLLIKTLAWSCFPWFKLDELLISLRKRFTILCPHEHKFVSLRMLALPTIINLCPFPSQLVQNKQAYYGNIFLLQLNAFLTNLTVTRISRQTSKKYTVEPQGQGQLREAICHF